MQKLTNLFLYVIFFIIIVSCSNKIFYNTDLNSKVVKKGLNVNKIQFYLSKKVVLKRELPLKSSAITNGEIQFEDGRYVEQIIINKNTPGTCEFMDDGIMFVSFEDGDNKFLKFFPVESGEYELFINPDPKNLGTIAYDTAQYVIQPCSARARLWVRKDQYYIFKSSNRVAEGKIISDE
jgi:hypothetical protein